MDTGLLILRLGLGLTLAVHGLQKLFGWFGGLDLSSTGAAFAALGYRPGKLFALLAGLAEAAGGVLLAIGFLTPLAAVAVMSAMLGATHLRLALSVTARAKLGWITCSNIGCESMN